MMVETAKKLNQSPASLDASFPQIGGGRLGTIGGKTLSSQENIRPIAMGNFDPNDFATMEGNR